MPPGRFERGQRRSDDQRDALKSDDGLRIDRDRVGIAADDDRCWRRCGWRTTQAVQRALAASSEQFSSASPARCRDSRRRKLRQVMRALGPTRLADLRAGAASNCCEFAESAASQSHGDQRGGMSPPRRPDQTLEIPMATIIKTHTPQQPRARRFRGVAYDLTDMAPRPTTISARCGARRRRSSSRRAREAARMRQDAEAAGRRAAEQAIERILDEKVAKQMKTLTPALQAAVEADRRRQAGLAAALGNSRRSTWPSAIAERLVRGELTRRPEIASTWIREALELAAGSGDVDDSPPPRRPARRSSGRSKQLAAAFAPAGDGAGRRRRSDLAGRLPRRHGVRHHRPAAGRRSSNGSSRNWLSSESRVEVAHSLAAESTYWHSSRHLDTAMLAGLTGSVVQTTGLTAAVAGMPAPVGAVVGIARQSGGEVEAEVIGFRDEQHAGDAAERSRRRAPRQPGAADPHGAHAQDRSATCWAA